MARYDQVLPLTQDTLRILNAKQAYPVQVGNNSLDIPFHYILLYCTQLEYRCAYIHDSHLLYQTCLKILRIFSLFLLLSCPLLPKFREIGSVYPGLLHSGNRPSEILC
jgi:hypothetical protein